MPSLTNKLLRLLWNVAYLFLFKPSPKPFFLFRVLILRLFFARIHHSAKIYPTAIIWAPWNLVMDSKSCIGELVNCYSVDKIVIGSESTVSQGSFLCTASKDFYDRSMGLLTGPISIGKNTWIGANVFIGPGSEIRDDVIICAQVSIRGIIQSNKIVKLNQNFSIEDRD
jgi:putative colanic acid biosynthesis acetyltransferase WcaF